MRIILLIKHIYSELIKDLFKILKIFFLIKKITVKNPIGKILINNEYHEDFHGTRDFFYLIKYCCLKIGLVKNIDQEGQLNLGM